MKIKDLPQHERPRERLIERSAANIKDAELLAILFRTGKAGKSALDLARDVLKKHNMKRLLSLSFDELLQIRGIDQGKACTLLAACELTKRALDALPAERPILSSSQDVWLQVHDLQRYKKEYLIALYLNGRNELLHRETISVGNTQALPLHPREIYHQAVEHLASSVILAHNHPSGSAQPSPADIKTTYRIQQAGEILGIELLDNLIIGRGEFVSLREEGLMVEDSSLEKVS